MVNKEAMFQWLIRLFLTYFVVGILGNLIVGFLYLIFGHGHEGPSHFWLIVLVLLGWDILIALLGTVGHLLGEEVIPRIGNHINTRRRL